MVNQSSDVSLSPMEPAAIALTIPFAGFPRNILRPGAISPAVANAIALVLLGIIGIFDYLTGQISLSIFYLAPVALSTWYAGRASGWSISFLSAVMWLVANVTLHPAGYRSGLLYWDAAVLGFTYALVVQLLYALQRVQTTLRTRLEQRTISLAEVHHRVKNNLQIISSLLMLRAEKLANPADRAVFGECRERIHSMARLHEQLYSGRELSQLDFAAHLRELASMLVRSHTPPGCALTLQVRADPLPLDLDRAVTLSLLANELILNALKHAFIERAAGKISVCLRARPRVEMTVQDDGRGLPPGFDAKEDGGLGLELVRAMVQQIAGEAVILNDSSGGTSATISFPPLPRRGRPTFTEPSTLIDHAKANLDYRRRSPDRRSS